MPVTLACPLCGGHLAQDDRLADQICACPHCRGDFRMPRSALPAAPLAVPAMLAPAEPRSAEISAESLSDIHRPDPETAPMRKAGQWNRIIVIGASIALIAVQCPLAYFGWKMISASREKAPPAKAAPQPKHPK